MEQEVIVHGNLVSLRRWKIFKAAAWVKKRNLMLVFYISILKKLKRASKGQISWSQKTRLILRITLENTLKS